MSTDPTPDDYITRLLALAANADPVRRFYLAIEDDGLRDLEEALADRDRAMDLHDALLAQYRAWRNEMRPEEWADVVAYNASLADADRNWIISEELAEATARAEA